MSTYSERRCDRCGREIKINQFPTLRTNLIRTIKFLGFSPYDYVDRKYELCDKCTKEFEKWVEEGGEDKQINSNRECGKCEHRYTQYDEAFIVGGEHYYCNIAKDLCIDGYWHDHGKCQYYTCKRNIEREIDNPEGGEGENE